MSDGTPATMHFDELDPRAARPEPERFGFARRLLALCAVVGAIGCLAGLVLAARAGDARQFFYSYLTAYLFCLTLPLGLLFFVMLHHVVDAGWSVVVRRPAEQVLAALPVLVLLFVPVLVGGVRGEVWPWMAAAHEGSGFGVQGSGPSPRPSPGVPGEGEGRMGEGAHATEGAHAAPGGDAHHGELLAKKRPYLNVPFFVVRLGVYFAVWNLLAWKLRGSSIAQDGDGAARWTFAMRRWSAPGFYVYALTFTFAIFDWVMSLDYRWFSTILGVYGWAGSVVGSLALLILITLAMAKGPLRGLVSSDHLHDLGKLLFAFSVFWAYIAFSQYFLIWYGNIPEETEWYLHRWTGMEHHSTWWVVSVILPVAHFAIPFLVLLAAAPKRNPKVLATMGVLLLGAHWLDVYWMVQPALNPAGPALKWLWLDAAALLAIGGTAGWWVVRAMGRAALYPVRDPRLHEALMAEHVEEVLGAEVE